MPHGWSGNGWPDWHITWLDRQAAQPRFMVGQAGSPDQDQGGLGRGESKRWKAVKTHSGLGWWMHNSGLLLPATAFPACAACAASRSSTHHSTHHFIIITPLITAQGHSLCCSAL